MPVDSLPSTYPARPYIWHFSIVMPIYMTFDNTITHPRHYALKLC
ncbi:hypothetical protein [Escherichia coli]